MFSGSRKGAGQIQGLLIALALIMLIVTPLGLYLGALNSEHGIDSSEFDGVINATDDYYTHVHQLQNESSGLEEDPDSFGVVTGLTSVTSVITGSVNFMQALITALISMMPVDVSWLLGPLILIVILIIALGVANWLRGGGSPL